MAAKLYRKKPVVIEAVCWDGNNVLEVYSFMHGAPTLDSAVAQDRWFDFENIRIGKDWHIKTLEDGPNGEAKHVASVGDWIIKGVEGEFYPCKPSVFATTYEPSDAPAPVTTPPTRLSVTEAAKRYLAAIDSERKRTSGTRGTEGASKSASDWSWAEHGKKIEACLSDLRAALASDGQP